MIRRLLLAVLALLLLAGGGAAIVGGVWLLGTFGSDGVLRGSLGRIEPVPGTLATIVDVDRFAVDVSLPEGLSETRLSVRPVQGDVLFLGAAPTADLDSYLAGSPYTVAARTGTTWETREVPGERPVDLPGPAAWWLAIDQGPQPAISVPAERPLTIVVAHPGAQPTGPIDVSYEVLLPQARAWAIGLFVAGGVLVLLGLAAAVGAVLLGRRRGRHQRRGAHAAA